MQPCGLCGFTDRQGAYVVAIISIADYCLHLVGICLALNGITPMNLSEVQLYALLVSTIILIFLSCLLLLGIRYESKCLILPWLIMVAFADIGYCSATIGSFIIAISTTHSDQNMIGFFIAMLNFCVVTYLLWVVLIFFIGLFSSSGYGRRSSSYDPLDNDDDIEADSRFRSTPRQHHHRPTIVSKLLPRDENN